MDIAVFLDKGKVGYVVIFHRRVNLHIKIDEFEVKRKLLCNKKRSLLFNKGLWRSHKASMTAITIFVRELFYDMTHEF